MIDITIGILLRILIVLAACVGVTAGFIGFAFDSAKALKVALVALAAVLFFSLAIAFLADEHLVWIGNVVLFSIKV